MGETFTPSDAEVLYLKEKIARAKEEMSETVDKRELAQRAYYRKLFGNEKKNRSKYVADDAANQVQAMLRELVKRHLGSDERIVFEAKDKKIAAALKKEIRERLVLPGGERLKLFHDVIVDCGINGNGTSKLWWERKWGDPEMQLFEKICGCDLKQMALDPQYEVDEEKMVPLPVEVVEVLDPGTGAYTKQEGKQYYRAAVKFTPLIDSGLKVTNIPPEQFLPVRAKVVMEDMHGVGHMAPILGGELLRWSDSLERPGQPPYFTKLKEAIEKGKVGSGSSLDSASQERQEREQQHWDADDGLAGADMTKLARMECELIEWYDFVADEHGRLRRAITTFCNMEMIRCEDNEDGFVNLVTWTAIPDPHSILGQSVAYNAAYDQDVRTVLTRIALDGWAMAIDRPRAVTDMSADMLGLQSLYAGKLVVAQQGSFQDLVTEPPDPRIFQVLEYLKQGQEERGPGTRITSGVGDNMERTATEATIMKAGAFGKIDLMSMCYAEMYLVPLYQKAVWLYQRNLDKPIEVEVDGEVVVLDQNTIQMPITVKADLGLELNFDERKYTQKMAQFQMMMQAIQLFPMLFPLEMVRQHLKEVYIEGGADDVNKLVSVIPDQLKEWVLGMPLPWMQPMGPPAGGGAPGGQEQPPQGGGGAPQGPLGV